jgi:hypothetical protein
MKVSVSFFSVFKKSNLHLSNVYYALYVRRDGTAGIEVVGQREM